MHPRQPQAILEFERWLFSLLWERKLTGGGDGQEEAVLAAEEHILRIKGILMLKVGERVRPYALQVVQDKYDLEPLHHLQADPSPAIIFIGILSAHTEQLLRSSMS